MKTKFLLLLLVFVIGQSVQGQPEEISVEAIIEKDIKGIRRRGADTIFIYTEYCYGCMLPSTREEDCQNTLFNHTWYFIWKKNGNTFFKVRDDCFEYNTIKVSGNFLDYVYSVKDSLIKDELKSPKYYSSHGSGAKVILLDGKNDFQVSFSWNYFGSDTTYENIVYNNSTLTKYFWDRTENYLKRQLLPRIIPSRGRKLD